MQRSISNIVCFISAIFSLPRNLFMTFLHTANAAFSLFLRVVLRHIASDIRRTLRKGFPVRSFPACDPNAQPSTFFCACQTVRPVSCIVSRTFRKSNQRFLSFQMRSVPNPAGICVFPLAFIHTTPVSSCTAKLPTAPARV